MSTNFPLPGKLVGFHTGEAIPAPSEIFFLLWKGRNWAWCPLYMWESKNGLGGPSHWQASAASVTNSVDISVLVQRLRLIFVNSSIFVF